MVISIRSCSCGDERCFEAYKSILEHAPDGDVWKEAPFRFVIDGNTTLKTWLVALSACHHIPSIADKLVAGERNFTINKLHYPRILLQKRSTYSMARLTTSMSRSLVNKLSQLDENRRMAEECNTVQAIIKRSKRQYPEFEESISSAETRCANVDKDDYVQSPCVPIMEVSEFLVPIKKNKSLKRAITTVTPSQSAKKRCQSPPSKLAPTTPTPPLLCWGGHFPTRYRSCVVCRCCRCKKIPVIQLPQIHSTS